MKTTPVTPTPGSDRFIAGVISQRRPILILWALLFCFFLITLLNFVFRNEAPIDNSVSIWFQQNDPAFVHYREFNRAFGEAEWTMLLLKTPSIYARPFLDQLDTLTSEIASLPHVQKTVSLTNAAATMQSPDGGFALHRVLDLCAARMQRDTTLSLKSLLSGIPGLRNIFLREQSDSFTVLLIKNDNLVRAKKEYRITLVDAIDRCVTSKSLISDHAIVGTTVINAELNRNAKNDAILFYCLVSAFLLIAAFFTMTYYRDTLVMLMIVVGTIIPVMGCCALFHIPFNMITVMLPTLLAAFSLADIVHVIDHFHKERRKPPYGVNRALAATIHTLWKPGLWTSLTTAIGLIALTKSDVIPVFQLGLMGSAGIVLAWIQTVTIGPALLSLLWKDSVPPPEEAPIRHLTPYDRLIAWVTGQHRRHPKTLIGMCLVLLLPLSGLPKLYVDTNYAEFFRHSSTVPTAYKLVKQAGFSQNPLSIQLLFKNNASLNSPGMLDAILTFEECLRKFPEIQAILSLSDRIRGAMVTQPGAAPSALSPDALQRLITFGQTRGNKDLLDYYPLDSSRVQIVAMTDYLSSKSLTMLTDSIISRAKECFSESTVETSITGTTSLWASMDAHISRTQLQSILVSFLFMALFLPLIFRSFTLGILALLINFTPIAIALGVMALCGIGINIATAIIGSISIGIVVDDTIHFITRYKLNLSSGKRPREAVAETMHTIGHSIVTTTLMLIGSFISLSFSSFLPTAHFGIFITLSVFLALYMDVFMLPLIIVRLGDKGEYHENDH